MNALRSSVSDAACHQGKGTSAVAPPRTEVPSGCHIDQSVFFSKIINGVSIV